jgi:hypothetical protein
MADDTVDMRAEVARLQAERDSLQAEVQSLGPRTVAKAPWWRRFLVVTLVVLSCLTFLAAVPGVWARRNFLDTDRFVSRAGPLIENPDVQDALSARITNEVMQLVDPRALFVQVLPERGQLLAAPLSNAVEGFVRNRVDDFVQTDQFARLWEGSIRVAHHTATQVLKGKSEALAAVQDGRVQLNILPMIDSVLKQITSSSPEILGRPVNIPDVTVDDVPQAAIARIESATGVKLDSNFGQFTVYDNGKLKAAQKGIKWFDRFVVLLVPIAAVFAALALWLSRRRRATLLQLSFGVVITMVLLRRVGFRIDDQVAKLPPSVEGRKAATAVLGAFLSPLTTFAGWAILTALLVAVVTLVTGNYAWAVKFRRRAAALWAKAVSTSGVQGHEDSSVAWVGAHRTLLLIAGAVVGLIILWTASLSWLGLLLVVGLVAAYELAVYRIGAASQPAKPA